MFFSNSCKSKNGENWLVLVLTDWNLEPSAYTRIEGKIWKCKVAPKNNVFFQKGLNGHAYIHIYVYMHIYAYFSTPGIQKMGKLTKFGVDMFFLKLLESKTWGKLISFGVDMFFSNSWSPKNGENWLVLVLTCFFLKLLVLTCFSQTRASQKNGENWLVLVLTDWNLEPLFLNITKILASHSKLLPNPPEMSKVLSSG